MVPPLLSFFYCVGVHGVESQSFWCNSTLSLSVTRRVRARSEFRHICLNINDRVPDFIFRASFEERVIAPEKVWDPLWVLARHS